MRKFIVLGCCILLAIALYFPTPADGYKAVTPSDLEFGYIPSIYAPGMKKDGESGMWTSDWDMTRYIKSGEQVLGSFRVFVRFIYDYEGFVSVYKYKIGEQTSAYGWKLYESGVTFDDNSITIHMELRKGIYRIPCPLTLQCDEEGRVSQL